MGVVIYSSVLCGVVEIEPSVLQMGGNYPSAVKGGGAVIVPSGVVR